MANEIKHHGIVESIDGSHVKVRIIQASACSSCSAKAHCGSAESKEKIVDIDNVDGALYHTRQQVIIFGTISIGMKAVLIAFVIPFIILLLTLSIVINVTGDEPLAAISALLSLLPYYIIVYLFRNQLKKKLSFKIKSII